MRLLEDPEVRVRLAVGQLLRSLAMKHGLSVLQTCQDTVLNSIHTHFVSTMLVLAKTLALAISSLLVWTQLAPVGPVPSPPFAAALQALACHHMWESVLAMGLRRST
jgi:hypothetical protein